jgi:hypothetical protein
VEVRVLLAAPLFVVSRGGLAALRHPPASN